MSATRQVTFNFKKLDSAHKNYEKDLAAMKAAGVKFEVLTEKSPTGEDVVTGIKREALTVTLPVFTMADFDPAFIQATLDRLTAEAVKKGYIDKFVPVPEVLTAADVVKALETSEGAGSSIPAALVEECVAFVKKVMQANSIPQAQTDILCGLLSHKFSVKAIKANILIAAKIPSMLAFLAKVYSGAPEEITAKHLPVLAACNENYEKFQKAQAEAESLEFSFS